MTDCLADMFVRMIRRLAISPLIDYSKCNAQRVYNNSSIGSPSVRIGKGRPVLSK